MPQSQKKKRLMTVEEYLRFEERSKYKHEYFDGEVIPLHGKANGFQMAGNRADHIFIVSNVSFRLRLALQNKDCLVGTTEMRVFLREGHYAYPDVFVVCGELLLVPDVFDTLENPAVIFEVLSVSTEVRDRGDKAHDYRNLPSLTDYVLISSEKMRVEQQIRQKDGSWKIVVFEKPDDGIYFSQLECEISVAEIYENIKFPPKPNLKLVETKNKKVK